ncbi:MAG: YjbH domain-containing protein [Candidatus Cloacimonetes bacterium]|nr:YjbH domain-containing protein [Candidatus Cloacimonadota bacterium]
MKIILCCLIILCMISILSGYELIYLADTPTAGILQYGEVLINTKMYRNNGIILGASVGLFSRFMLGVSYGGENIVGNESPNWHERPEVHAKYRIIDESPFLPAVVVGFDSQGHGVYHSLLKRYDIKSKGFYAAASRNYYFLGNLGLHLGTNYSMENKDEQKSINFFLGVDKSLGDELTLMIDYDFALNDKKPEMEELTFNESLWKRKGNGYLNLALYLRFTDFLAVKFIAYDVLENNRQTTGADRAILIDYNMKF